jgi:zinc/manganese transport system substrate-binding protein
MLNVRAMNARLPRRRFLGLLPAAVLSGCRRDEEPQAPPFPKVPWRVVSTTHFTADLVRAIGGESVESRCFLPPDVSPYAFVPGAPELQKFHTADMIIIHGLGLESRWREDFDSLAGAGVRVFSATSAIPPERILRPSGPGGPPDPHVWTEPELAARMVDAVESALTTVMPKLAEYFRPRAHKLRVEFQDAMKFTAAKMKELTADDRFLLTSHDTMKYFAATFGLEARALTAADGKLPEEIPAELAEWIRGHNIRSLFRESFTDVLTLRSLMQEFRVNPDHVLYSLALPSAGTSALVLFKSYDVSLATGALQHNADIIQSTLQVD